MNNTVVKTVKPKLKLKLRQKNTEICEICDSEHPADKWCECVNGYFKCANCYLVFELEYNNIVRCFNCGSNDLYRLDNSNKE